MKVKDFLAQWFPVYLIALVILFIAGSFFMKACWQGYQIDEQKLMDLCGITMGELFTPVFSTENCPEAGQVFVEVQICYTNWPLVYIMIGSFSILFFIVALLMYRSDDSYS